MPTIELNVALNDLEPNGMVSHEATVDTLAESDVTVAGGDFAPSLTRQPKYFVLLDSTGTQLNINAPSSELNGSVYDVTFQTTDELLNCKLIALCTRS